MEKIRTGIEGLDKMLGGGLIQGRPYLIAGGPGLGKTILSTQFLVEGTKTSERGLFLSLEERAAELSQDISQFGWDLSRIKIIDTIQEDSGMWTIRTDTVVSRPEISLTNLTNIVKEKLKTFKPKRLVIDSITTIKMMYEQPVKARRELLSLMNFLSKTGCTSLLTVETYNEDTTMEEFLASGVIKIHKIDNRGEQVSAISIEKMRGTDFDHHLRPMKITSKGIVVFPDESMFPT